MPLFVNKNVSPGSRDKDSTSDAADEQDVSGLPDSAGSFGAFRGFGTPPGSDDPVPESVPAPPDGFDPSGGDGSGGGPGPVIAVTSGGITFNLTFDSFAPASFRAGIQQAASILTSMISDQITVNLNIHYTGTGGGANAGPSTGLFESYSATTAALINHASLGDTIFNAVPGGSSIQGQSQVAVWNAQLKALGFLSATASGSDGTANFATDISSNLLVGVALHELTHAMGRVPYGTGVDIQGRPDIFDLFRFTSAGTRLFTGSATSAAAAYFSVNGGSTKLADYGRTSDTSDFLNSGVQGGNDPFNEFYTGSTSQQLSTADLLQLDALGFHLTGYAPTAVELSGSTSIYHSNVNNSYYLVPAGTSSGAQPQLRYAGAGVTPGQFGPLSPIGAERNGSGGYSVVWKWSGADQYTVWTTDGAGNYASQTPMVTSASWYVQSLEQSFAQDLNGDGRIGPVTTNVEAAGSTTLAQVADSYFLYAAGGSSGPQLRYAGAYVAAGQFGPWTPLGAEHNASGGYSVRLEDRRAPINTRCGPPTAAATTPRRHPSSPRPAGTCNRSNRASTRT